MRWSLLLFLPLAACGGRTSPTEISNEEAETEDGGIPVIAIPIPPEDLHIEVPDAFSTTVRWFQYGPWLNLRYRPDTRYCYSPVSSNFWAPCDGNDPTQALQFGYYYGPSNAGSKIIEWPNTCLAITPGRCLNWTQDSNGELHDTTSGLCLDIENRQRRLSTCSGNNQFEQWEFVNLASPAPRFGYKALHSRCLDDGASTEDWSPILSFPCWGASIYQQFHFDPVTRQIVDQLDSRCLTANGVNNGDLVVKTLCHGWTNQQWYPTSDGQIISEWNNKCVEVAGANLAYAAKVQMMDCNGSVQQAWQVNDPPLSLPIFP